MTSLCIIVACIGFLIAFHLHMIGTALMDIRDEIKDWTWEDEEDSN